VAVAIELIQRMWWLSPKRLFDKVENAFEEQSRSHTLVGGIFISLKLETKLPQSGTNTLTG
jgi:hypothetical protein